MSLNCPSCGHRLAWGDLQPRFSCPKCATSLKSNNSTVLVIAFLLVTLPIGVLTAAPAWVAALVLVVMVVAIWGITHEFTKVERAPE